ncbi:MAG: phosphoribosylanthranilate isomerase [Cyanobacteria bacterium J06649_11]
MCQKLKNKLPNTRLVKALRLKKADELTSLLQVQPYVDNFLIDAYHPEQMGGTGETVDWSRLKNFKPERPWLLAGGLTPENVKEATTLLQPNGIDLSSGVEISPGNKDLNLVCQLLETLNKIDQR